MFNREIDSEWADNYYTLEELIMLVEEERENMSDQERYKRIRDCEPTFLENVLSWAQSNIKDEQNEKIFLNEVTNKYEII